MRKLPGIFKNADGIHLPLDNTFRGQSCFLICGGPSFKSIPAETIKRLSQPGILTMAVNNSPKSFRPRLWVSVDDPSHFIRSIWFDSNIIKFTRDCHIKPMGDKENPHAREVYDSDASDWTGIAVRDCPSVVFFAHQTHKRFDAKEYLTAPTIYWGGREKKEGGDGGRSVMLAAVRILHLLGIANVYLLGADFDISEDKTYHFDQTRTASSVKSNRYTYEKLNLRFTLMRPLLEQRGMNIYNLNPASNLKAFDTMPVDEAIARALKDARMDFDLSAERTSGLYSRHDDEERAKREKRITAAMNNPQRVVKVLKDLDDKWETVPWDQVKRGDRIKLWDASGERVKAEDNSKEWTVTSVEKKSDGNYLVNKRHWPREVHIQHVKAGTLEAALGENYVAPLNEETSSENVK